MRKGDFVYNDFLLIRKMKQGDDNAFDLFVHKYYQEILSYCYHHCFDQTYAEDFTQETFIRFFSKLPDYHYKGKTLNYLYTIAGNLCKDYLKKTKETLLEEIELVEENQTETMEDELNFEFDMEELLKKTGFAMPQMADILQRLIQKDFITESFKNYYIRKI